jgi:ABC-type transporter Mla subunit MlaD
MNRRGASSIAANPVLIGAATALVTIVAMFLAYNANSGLPFVPIYELKAKVPNAANLVVGNEVRIGGARVGVISEIEPETAENGTVTALLTMKLQTNIKPLPKDSTLIVRPRSALGLKYVEITEGARNLPGGGDAPGFADGDTIPLSNATPDPVEIDQVFNMFNEPTRAASQTNLLEFGNAFAGRGVALNEAISVFPQLLPNLEKVMRNLSDPDTNLDNFFRSLGAAAAEAAPVAQQQASLFVNLDITFTALAKSLDPTLAFLTPAQTVCNYATLFFRNAASLLSEGDSNGTWQRFIVVVAPLGPNNEGAPASAPANGPTQENHLHANPYPNTAAPGQPRECEAGREPYAIGRTTIGNTPGTQPASTDPTRRDSSVPGGGG